MAKSVSRVGPKGKRIHYGGERKELKKKENIVWTKKILGKNHEYVHV